MKKVLPLITVLSIALNVVAGLTLLRQPPAKDAERPDAAWFEEITVVRMPSDRPDTPAPAGGKFLPVKVTFDGDRQVTADPQPAGPLWAIFLKGGRVVIHCVRVPG